MKILFIGSVEFSRAALIHLLKMKAPVVGIVTKEYSSFNADHSDISDLAKEASIPFKYVNDINHPNNLSWIKELQPDIIFCFGWSSLLKKELLSICSFGVIGYHPSLLPYNRGRHPIIWALALGLEITGSTFFFMDEGADTGDILSQKEVIIKRDDDAQSLYDRITLTALEQISEFVPALENNSYSRQKQNLAQGNTWRKRGADDGKIDWRMDSYSIYNLVRALSKPYPGAHCYINNKAVKIWSVSLDENIPSNLEPGKIVSVIGCRILVKTGNGGVWLNDHEIDLKEIGDYLI